MYGLGGERRLDEMELPWLPGYERRQPGAHRQRRRGAAAARRLWRGDGRAAPGPRQRRCCDGAGLVAAARHAGAPGDGLGASPTRACGRPAAAARHFTFSKVMAWVGVRPRHPRTPSSTASTATSSAGARCATRSTAGLRARDSTPDLNSFTQSFGDTALDASLLLIPITGFLPADDPRMVGTVAAIEARPDAGRVRAALPHRGRSRTACRRGGRVPGLQLLAGLGDAHAGAARRGAGAVRPSDRPVQRRRPAQRGVRPGRPAGSSATSRRRSATSPWSPRRCGWPGSTR